MRAKALRWAPASTTAMFMLTQISEDFSSAALTAVGGAGNSR